MKEGGNAKYLGIIIILKGRGVRKSLFRVSAPKETEDMGISLSHVGRIIYYPFSHVFAFTLVINRKGLESKNYPTMDLPMENPME